MSKNRGAKTRSTLAADESLDESDYLSASSYHHGGRIWFVVEIGVGVRHFSKNGQLTPYGNNTGSLSFSLRGQGEKEDNRGGIAFSMMTRFA